MGAAIKAIWEHPDAQKAFERKNEFQLNDSADYYFNDIDRISTAGYIPTEQDVLRSRVRTTGIVQSDFVIKKVNFLMFDVGGQRNERRKWIHAFDSVNAVIFVAALSEYDQTLYEDETQNRMTEALSLWDQARARRPIPHGDPRTPRAGRAPETAGAARAAPRARPVAASPSPSPSTPRLARALRGLAPRAAARPRLASAQILNSKWFNDTSMILFLNKKDLFEMKLKKNPLNKYYSEYAGGDNFDAACKFFKDKFMEKNKKEKSIYSHATCATDTSNVRFVFDSVVSIILEENMKRSGLG